MVMPVVYSAIAGATGAKSRGRNRDATATLPPKPLARSSAISFLAAPRENWIGTLESDSAPPASTTSQSPTRIASAAEVIARLDEAQARLTALPEARIGNDARNTTSRPR